MCRDGGNGGETDEVAVGGATLEEPRHRQANAGDQLGGTPYRVDRGGECATVVPLDEKQLFAHLRVVWERGVHEAKPVGLVDHLDDAAGAGDRTGSDGVGEGQRGADRDVGRRGRERDAGRSLRGPVGDGPTGEVEAKVSPCPIP